MKVFVTATGTDIGKTFVTCGLIRHLRAAGHTPVALKPIASGFTPAHAETSDPALLLAALGRPLTPENLAHISPWRFAAPLSPDWAAQAEGTAIDYQQVLAFCRARLRTPAPVLIEGVGGVMVPLDATHTVLDLMTDLALPVILVAGSYLGTLSHTLTAHAVLRQQGLACVLAVSESADSRIDPVQTAAALERRTGAPTLLLRRAGNPEAAFAALARAVAALPYFAGGGFSTNS